MRRISVVFASSHEPRTQSVRGFLIMAKNHKSNGGTYENAKRRQKACMMVREYSKRFGAKKEPFINRVTRTEGDNCAGE